MKREQLFGFGFNCLGSTGSTRSGPVTRSAASRGVRGPINQLVLVEVNSAAGGARSFVSSCSTWGIKRRKKERILLSGSRRWDAR